MKHRWRHSQWWCYNSISCKLLYGTTPT